MPDRPRVLLLAAFVFFAQFLGGGGGLIGALLTIRFTGQADAFFNLLVVGDTSPGGALSVVLIGLGVAGGAAAALYVTLRKTTEWCIGAGAALAACAIGSFAGLIVSAYFVTHGSQLELETLGRLFGFPLSLTTVVVTTALVARWVRPTAEISESLRRAAWDAPTASANQPQ